MMQTLQEATKTLSGVFGNPERRSRRSRVPSATCQERRDVRGGSRQIAKIEKDAPERLSSVPEIIPEARGQLSAGELVRQPMNGDQVAGI